MRKTYIVAVSGGVDSVVLLDMFMRRVASPQIPNTNYQPPIYIVAHVDHGIRDDSAKDMELVKNLSKKYGVNFETTQLKLGEKSSEDNARQLRYDFLFSLMKKYKAESIITAHHKDDILETVLVNMIRGTGPRGLVGFSRPGILRPFVNKTKSELLEYAKYNNLQWREDSTNADPKYLRNYIRLKIVPKMSEAEKQKILSIRVNVEQNYYEIDQLTKKLLVQTMEKGELVRSRFVILPYRVQQELIAVWFRLEGLEIDKGLIERSVLAIKTFLPNKKFQISKSAYLLMGKNTIILKKVHSAHV